MMVLTRCSAQSTIASAIFGAVADRRLSATSDGQLVKPDGSQPSFGSQPSLTQLIRLRREYDLVFIPGFQTIGLFTLLICKLLGKTCILKVDNAEEVSELSFTSGLIGRSLRSQGLLFRALLSIHNRFLRYVDAFVTSSYSVADKLIARGIDPAIVHTIPDSVDVDKFRKATEEEKAILRGKLGIPVSTTVVACAGHSDRLDRGLSLLLRVWCEILRQHDNVLLLLVDSNTSDERGGQVEPGGLARSYVYEEGILFAGGELSVDSYLQASDVYVAVTENPAFKFSLLEAMACELPIIAARTDETDGVIRQGQNGLIVEKGDFQQLFEATEALVVNPVGAKRLGQCARKTIEQNYAVASVAEAYAKLFCAIADNNGR
jgi:glycosyltransferase involved in cell wall biosynthesis